MENTEKELTPQEKALLDHPDQRAELPPHLYTKIVQAMKTEALLRTPRPLLALSLQGILTAALALVVVAGLGYWAGKSTLHAAVPIAAAETGKAKFILLVHNDDVAEAQHDGEAERAVPRGGGEVVHLGHHGHGLERERDHGGVDGVHRVQNARARVRAPPRRARQRARPRAGAAVTVVVPTASRLEL